MSHELQNTWVIWEHKSVAKGGDWNDAMKEVCEFSTVEQFWKYWSFIPRPGEVFTGGSTRKELHGRTLDAFSVFKKGIRPEWEDVANKFGSEYKTVRPLANDADQHWENMVIAMIGEVLDENNEICGCRVVDKSKKEKKLFRLELWLRGSDPIVGSCIKSRLLEALNEGHPGKSNIDFERKSRQEH